MSNLDELLDRAATDATFRNLLKANPAATLRDHGIDLSSGCRVEVIETRPNEIHLNLGRKAGPPQLQKILDRAENDPAFRKRLCESPRSVLEQSLGDAIPSGVAVHVHERPRDKVMRLFLPPSRDTSEGELSDAELESVAGGTFLKNVVGGIREWICKDSRTIGINEKEDVYAVVTDTSHKDPTMVSGSLIVW